MKKFFLYAVATTAIVLQSCSTDDEQNIVKQQDFKHSVNTNYKTTVYNTMDTILEGFNYNDEKSLEENLIDFEMYANKILPVYTEQGIMHQTIDFNVLKDIIEKPDEVIHNLPYSNALKQYLQNPEYILDDKVLETDNEKEIYYNCRLLFKTVDDNKDDRIREISAYAYGSQYNETQGILYAGATQMYLQNK